MDCCSSTPLVDSRFIPVGVTTAATTLAHSKGSAFPADYLEGLVE